MATPGVESGLPPMKILAKLVNNKYLADAVFKVGQSGTLMYAHKNIITLGSEVFFAQFNGQFTEAQQDTHVEPIVLEDIEPDTFLEVLRNIYCRQTNLTAGNMLDVYYAASKYLLRELQVLCEKFIFREITDENLLQVFQHNRRYQFDFVDQVCLRNIVDNPLKFFKQKDFLELDQVALELIVKEKRINCDAEQLKEAVKQWGISNGPLDIVVEPRLRNCRKVNFFGTPNYSSHVKTDIRLTVASPMALYGVGIFVCVKPDSFLPNCFVVITVSINQVKVASKTVPVSQDLHTCELMFEKFIVGISDCMQVDITKSSDLRCNNLLYIVNHNLVGVLGSSQLGISNNNYESKNCVSYLLCQTNIDPPVKT